MIKICIKMSINIRLLVILTWIGYKYNTKVNLWSIWHLLYNIYGEYREL